jgi:hypothetical protein
MTRFLAIFALILSVIATPVLAARSETITVDTSKLTQAQVDSLQRMVESTKSPDAQITENISRLATWGTDLAVASEGFAKALGVAARELGIAANDFLATDAGRLTAAIIIWKVLGKSLVALVIGTLLLVISIGFYFNVVQRCMVSEYTYKPRSLLFGLIKYEKAVPVYKREPDWDAWVVSTIALGMAVGASLAIMFS